MSSKKLNVITLFSGNSIVVACLYHIFRRLLTETEAEQGQQLSIF